jgi:hypothetical protein
LPQHRDKVGNQVEGQQQVADGEPQEESRRPGRLLRVPQNLAVDGELLLEVPRYLLELEAAFQSASSLPVSFL